MSDVLQTGWTRPQVESQHFLYATDLVRKGVAFRSLAPDHRPEVQELIRTHIAGSGSYCIPDEAGGIVGYEQKTGLLLGAMILAGAKFRRPTAKETTVVFVNHLVVTPAWRKQGLGYVLLQMSPMVQTFDVQVGVCDPAGSEFYHRSGFTVLKPGAPLPAMVFGGHGAAADWGTTNEFYPSWFFRHWHLEVNGR